MTKYCRMVFRKFTEQVCAHSTIPAVRHSLVLLRALFTTLPHIMSSLDLSTRYAACSVAITLLTVAERQL